LNEPIFVIGCGRSGTTLLRLMLDSHPRISAGEETKFLVDFERILTDHWSLLKAYGFPREWWVGRIRSFYQSFQTEYLKRRGKARWAEKSPIYTFHLEFIGELFPDAQYVHVIRDGRDVVASFRERWGYLAGLRAANSIWRESVVRAREFGARLPAGRYHELRYEALVADAEKEMRSLLSFLGEEWDPRVLRFHEVEHDSTARYAAYTSGRREAAGDPSAPIYRAREGAGRRRLDPALAAVLQRSSGKLLTELGYTG
jgi:hypothetical protein